MRSVYDVLDSPIPVDVEAKRYCTRLFGAALGSQSQCHRFQRRNAKMIYY
jgi:hypothetical protein